MVDVDDLVNILQTVDAVALAGTELRAVQIGRELFIQNVVDQRGLATAGYTGDAGHHAERDGDIDVLQIVLCRASNNKRVSVSLSPL